MRARWIAAAGPLPLTHRAASAAPPQPLGGRLCSRRRAPEGKSTATIVDSIEIDRSPGDAFAYFADLGKHGEWQRQIDRAHDTDGLTQAGSPRPTNAGSGAEPGSATLPKACQSREGRAHRGPNRQGFIDATSHLSSRGRRARADALARPPRGSDCVRLGALTARPFVKRARGIFGLYRAGALRGSVYQPSTRTGRKPAYGAE